MIYGSEERFWVIASMAVVDLEMITLREEGLREVFCYDSRGFWAGIRPEGRRKGFAQICTDSVETRCPLSGNT